MAFVVVKILLIAAACAVAAALNHGNIQLQPTQGILIPGPLAQTFLRAPRSPAYGGAPAAYSQPAYAAPAPAPAPAAQPVYSAPSAPAPAPAYSAPVSIAAPPCPRNYLFGCSPSLAPVPCSAPSALSGDGYSVGAPIPAHLMGAHSEFVPQYAVPDYAVPYVQEIY